MTPGISVILNALDARWNQQEITAQNISAASGVGHKRKVGAFTTFDAALQQAGGQTLPVSATTSVPQPSAFDMTPGESNHTGEPLDVAINGEGFFSVKTPQGLRLTRNGHFTLDKTNRLVTAAGYPVQGPRGDIRLPPGTVAIQQDGSILVNGAPAGQLQVVTPPKGAQLTSETGGLFDCGSRRPVPKANAELVPGALESSNIELPTEMVAMVQNQRMYDMLTRAYQAQDEGLGRAIQDLSS